MLLSPAARSQISDTYSQAAAAWRNAGNQYKTQANKICCEQHASYNDCLARGGNCGEESSCQLQPEGAIVTDNTAGNVGNGGAKTVGSAFGDTGPVSHLSDNGGGASPDREYGTYTPNKRAVRNTGPDSSVAVAKSRQLISDYFKSSASGLADELMLKNLMAHNGEPVPHMDPSLTSPAETGSRTVVDYNNRQPNGDPTITVYPSGPVPREISFPEPDIDLAPAFPELRPTLPGAPATQEVLPSGAPVPDLSRFTSPPIMDVRPPIALENSIGHALDLPPDEEQPSLLTRINPFYYVGKAGAAAGEWVGQKWIQLKKDTNRSRDEWFPFEKFDDTTSKR